MAETKYGKHIVTDVIKPPFGGVFGKYWSLGAQDGELGVDCSVGWHTVAGPIEFKDPHTHDFAEILCFIGGDATNIRDLGAEIEVCLGEEQEMHVLTSAAVVSIPAGLVHNPLRIKNVKKPFVFLSIMLTRSYKH